MQLAPKDCTLYVACYSRGAGLPRNLLCCLLAYKANRNDLSPSWVVHNHNLTLSTPLPPHSLTHPGVDVRLVPEPVPDVLDVRLATIRVLVDLILGPLEELRTQGTHVLLPAHLVSVQTG